MTVSLKFYADSSLTTPLDSNPLTLDREIGGNPVDVRVYVGSTASGRYFVPDNSGDSQIIATITDSDAGAGFAPEDIALALTQSGLDSATPGDPLDLGDQIDSGSANAIAVWLRFSGESGTPKSSADLGLTLNPVREYAS
ncbi:hypothetical protein SR882_10240 [Guyparkeria halophila]|uniref:Uncharacterized protein n=1 Tax=Guyparkeria halophila TaxID=47960 RepID=A0ABZ0YXK1_9GAMM|nr:hypothetical protein [Guyparkeria halophila]WQH16129.1 hypothetical protein SR882_10240 [Guyparkeria halophila]